jgi:Flp pilus assembly protein TadG
LNPVELRGIVLPDLRGRRRAQPRPAFRAGVAALALLGSARPTPSSRAPRPRNGQSLTEFALILPVLLGLLGAGIDFARLYNTWINLEAATRDAAEYVATCVNGSSLLVRCDGVGASTTALAQAKRVVCTALDKPATCTDPAVTVPTYTQDPAFASGGSVNTPVTTVSVRASLTFRTIFPYPLFTNNGARTLVAVRQYKIIQGR